MKNLLLSLFLLTAIVASGQNDCSPYVPVTVGSKWEITNYSDKGKIESKVAYELTEKNEVDEGTEFAVKTQLYDKKGEKTYEDEFKTVCKDGQYKIDMSVRMNQMGMENYEGMDVDVESTDLEIPGINASEGSELKDAFLNIKVSTNSMAIMKMTVEITERKVEASEKRECPAGSFDCLIVYQKISIKSIMNTESYSREWYAKEVGMVRSEAFNKNGKLTGYSELTMLEVM